MLTYFPLRGIHALRYVFLGGAEDNVALVIWGVVATVLVVGIQILEVLMDFAVGGEIGHAHEAEVEGKRRLLKGVKHFPKIVEIYAALVGFALAFRINIAMARYNEGVGNVEAATAHFWSGANMLMCFANASRVAHLKNPEMLMRLENFKAVCIHWMSLLGAVSTLSYKTYFSIMPCLVSSVSNRVSVHATGLTSCTGYRFRNEKVLAKAVAMDAKLKPVLFTDHRKSYGMYSQASQAIWTGGGEPLKGDMVGNARAYLSRSILDNCVPFGEDAEAEHAESPYSCDVLGPLYLEECLMLNGTKERVDLVRRWILELLLKHIHIGDMKAPPPMVGAVHNYLSTGSEHVKEAQKIANIPFPMPFAQTIEVLVLPLLLIMVPLSCVAYSNGVWFPILMSVTITIAYNRLNNIAKELENPFGEDMNDLPLVEMHANYIDHLQNVYEAARFSPEEYELKITKRFMHKCGFLHNPPKPGLAPTARRGARGIRLTRPGPDRQMADFYKQLGPDLHTCLTTGLSNETTLQKDRELGRIGSNQDWLKIARQYVKQSGHTAPGSGRFAPSGGPSFDIPFASSYDELVYFRSQKLSMRREEQLRRMEKNEMYARYERHLPIVTKPIMLPNTRAESLVKAVKAETQHRIVLSLKRNGRQAKLRRVMNKIKQVYKEDMDAIEAGVDPPYNEDREIIKNLLTDISDEPISKPRRSFFPKFSFAFMREHGIHRTKSVSEKDLGTSAMMMAKDSDVPETGNAKLFVGGAKEEEVDKRISGSPRRVPGSKPVGGADPGIGLSSSNERSRTGGQKSSSECQRKDMHSREGQHKSMDEVGIQYHRNLSEDGIAQQSAETLVVDGAKFVIDGNTFVVDEQGNTMMIEENILDMDVKTSKAVESSVPDEGHIPNPNENADGAFYVEGEHQRGLSGILSKKTGVGRASPAVALNPVQSGTSTQALERSSRSSMELALAPGESQAMKGSSIAGIENKRTSLAAVANASIGLKRAGPVVGQQSRLGGTSIGLRQTSMAPPGEMFSGENSGRYSDRGSITMPMSSQSARKSIYVASGGHKDVQDSQDKAGMFDAFVVGKSTSLGQASVSQQQITSLPQSQSGQAKSMTIDDQPETVSDTKLLHRLDTNQSMTASSEAGSPSGPESRVLAHAGVLGMSTGPGSPESSKRMIFRRDGKSLWKRVRRMYQSRIFSQASLRYKVEDLTAALMYYLSKRLDKPPLRFTRGDFSDVKRSPISPQTMASNPHPELGGGNVIPGLDSKTFQECNDHLHKHLTKHVLAQKVEMEKEDRILDELKIVLIELSDYISKDWADMLGVIQFARSNAQVPTLTKNEFRANRARRAEITGGAGKRRKGKVIVAEEKKSEITETITLEVFNRIIQRLSNLVTADMIARGPPLLQKTFCSKDHMGKLLTPFTLTPTQLVEEYQRAKGKLHNEMHELLFNID